MKIIDYSRNIFTRTTFLLRQYRIIRLYLCHWYCAYRLTPQLYSCAPQPLLFPPPPEPYMEDTGSVTAIGSSGMWCFRMWALNIIVDWPSTTEGPGTSRLKLIWVRGFKLLFSNPTSWNTKSLKTQTKLRRCGKTCYDQGIGQWSVQLASSAFVL